ncbi:uncharacterized protein STEHIDRAFT_182878 [Stereum hirsutum FP-91666 SS1]|uniref:uncharacterized protein n=1 Tax=Stereum hirsutum (strain FP-91666) TaxID=721885 RepID=UPI000440DF82|nr:uncharacterized protein STEHIDRAFT_182878 [Stereum hirsutum FP-91666 SS1]EIM91691.1 hypothetical protein STEHIDRAFT_182878 [Stereum hirsutum FP-91666 SS1]
MASTTWFPMLREHTISFIVMALFLLETVMASHSVTMVNRCGFGTPTLDQIPSNTLATGEGEVYTNDTLDSGQIFLNDGTCGPNGGHCTTITADLGVLTGGSSSVVVNLIPTHAFSVPVQFSYYNGCDGAGVSCLTSSCEYAIRDPPETSGIVNCTDTTASVEVIFCP